MFHSFNSLTRRSGYEEEKGKGKKLARSLASLLCATHRTHFLMVVCHAFGVGQERNQRESFFFVYFSWLEAVADEFLWKQTENPSEIALQRNLIGKFVLSEAKRMRREARQNLSTSTLWEKGEVMRGVERRQGRS